MLSRSARRARTRGFTLIEVLVVIAIIALLLAILLPALGSARRAGRLAACTSNMRSMGQTLGTYAATFGDIIYSFSWNRGTRMSEFADLNDHHDDDLEAAADQAVDIIRRRGDRGTELFKQPNWIPHIAATHLVALDFLTARLPSAEVTCPEDRTRLRWARDPKAFERQEVDPYPAAPYGPPARFGQTWPYSSSYYNVVASFERTPGSLLQVQEYLYNYYPDRGQLGQNRVADVAFPSSKVFMYDDVARHHGRAPSYWGYDDVRMPLTFFDSSVRTMKVGDSNPGWNPRNPATDRTVEFRYRPTTAPSKNVWMPPPRDPSGVDRIRGRFLWTRGGIRGVDFGGGEINTGQPTP